MAVVVEISIIILTISLIAGLKYIANKISSKNKPGCCK